MSEGPRHRFFVEALPEEGGVIEPSSEVARHVRVLRLEVGEEVMLFDGSGREARAHIEALTPLRLAASVPTVAAADRPEIHLIQAMPKGKKLDAIVRMSTELGVDAIHLAITERAISRPEGSKAEAKITRLEKIAREASRQARRRTTPSLVAPAPLGEVIARAKSTDKRLVFWEEAEDSRLPPSLSDASRVWVLVGPEGGLSHTEVGPLQQSGWVSVRLGATILRVETASPTALALVLYRAGRFRR